MADVSIYLCSATGPFQQGDVLDLCVTGGLSVSECRPNKQWRKDSAWQGSTDIVCVMSD